MTDQNDIRRLARAVVRQNTNAMLIDETNRGCGWVPLDNAVDSGGAFLVQPKSTLATFDLDTDELVSLGRRLDDSLGLPALWVNSGRNTHLFIRCDDGAEEIEQAASSIGLPPECFRSNKGIRPPLSPHRLGLPVELIGASVEEALEILGPPETPKCLPPWFDRTLSEGDYSGRFGGNRSNMALAIASAMKTAGMTLADYRIVMTNRTNLGAEKVHEMEDRGQDAEAFIIRTWDKAQLSTKSYDADHTEAVRRAVESSEWKGKAGGSQRSVMLALCSLSDNHGTSTPTFGVRTLAIKAGMSDSTVKRALAALTEQGWTSRVRADGRGQADGYRLLVPVGVSNRPHLLPSP
ncbi:helix-turn-helix domain-containing protein [Gordonia sp. PDNC005]|uniref:helix-turn-helix domain-containing protein n=1 Tax=Gordonia sp. PDNC005 TaxID=2811424 RepID=UPI001965661E|nr:helix-turn-helix domain-containing protein [Gordonia sp. PDNC005]QRY63443.1 helix-turn-helix domain-containing protein [Gordonia sp. PDNC005]